jgi:hypothetical protein
MRDKPRFRVSGSRIRLKASCTARNEGYPTVQEDREETYRGKSKMEKRRIRKRFERMKQED